MSLVKPGKYLARIVEHAITETKSGEPQAVVKFGFDVEETYRELNWFGSFKEKALEHTLRALVNCGLKGNSPAGPLELGKEVSITVETDVNQDGKERNVVRWVNKIATLGKKVDDMTAKAKLEKYSGAVMALKQREGAPQLKNHAPTGTDDDEFGF